MSDNKQVMDKRCLLKLKDLPQQYCPLAVLRLKQLRNAGKELTEQEENKLAGCPWAINDQSSCYCFFKYSHFYLDKPVSEVEIAHMNNISIETVKKIEKESLEKIRNLDDIKNIKKVFQGENVIDSEESDPEYNIIYK